MIMMTGFSRGDLVFVHPHANHLVRGEEICPKAVVLQTIPGGWYRICMTWGEKSNAKSKIFDIPETLLTKVVQAEVP